MSGLLQDSGYERISGRIRKAITSELEPDPLSMRDADSAMESRLGYHI